MVDNDLDCNDQNDRAYTGSTWYQIADRGDGSWDYNCDGMISIARMSDWECSTDNERQIGVTTEGWVDEIPYWGEAGEWLPDGETCSGELYSSGDVIEEEQSCY